MKFYAEINIMPLDGLLDPQGKTVLRNLNNIDVEGIHDLRIGKHMHMELDAVDEKKARSIVDSACKKLLANPIMEKFEFTIELVSS